tara:strand:+ start:1480 stop:1740 length:261 start_codon:yes stop_codon:yes gene_type:complete
MDHCCLCVIYAVIISILLNIILPMILVPYATPEEIKPPLGANSLSMKSQFMHMMVHHNQVPFMSSIIVGLIVGLSVWFSYQFVKKK